MITFYLLASVLVLLTIAILVRSVLRGGGEARELEAENIAIAREQLAALDATRAAGTLDETDYAEERARIETTLARELDGARRTGSSRALDLSLIGLIVLAVPVASALLYVQLGTPEAILANTPAPEAPAPGSAPTDANANAEGAPALDELIPRLEQRLAETPDDVMGWRLLGRTWIGLEQFGRAVAPLQRAIELEPNDAGTHTLLAEAEAMQAGGNLNGAALASLERAHTLDPMHEQTLWLLGVARQQAERHGEAVDLLTTLRGIAEAAGNAQAVSTIDEYLAVSRAALAARGEATPDDMIAPDASEEAPATSSGDAVSITVAISLGEEAAAATSADQAVFVYARAVDGPPMPLAVQRLTVADLPAIVVLDESMAMLPNMTLAQFADVSVGARVSLSGQPVPAPGDWSIERAARVGDDGTTDAPLALEIVEPVR